MISPITGEVLFEAGTVLTEEMALQAQYAAVNEVTLSLDNGDKLRVIANNTIEPEHLLGFDLKDCGVNEKVRTAVMLEIMQECAGDVDAIKAMAKARIAELCPKHITKDDIFASISYMIGPKLVEIGLLDNPEAYKAEYYKYILNGMMTQLMRIEPGKDVEESHMRNRKLIAEWAYENGKAENVIELDTIDGKTFIKINDYDKLRGLFGSLLKEIQRIKSEGDYEAGRNIVEKYAVKVNPALHKEVLDRYATLNIAPYKGFVNPIYTPVYDAEGKIVDVTLNFEEDYVSQMLRYSREYSPLTK